jgi:DNA-directed RNA polymerase specialized sigma24 family protein
MLAAEGQESPRPHVPVRSRDDVTPRPPGRDADQAVAVLYDTHCRPLTRLATLLASDEAIAEEIVRDAFVAMHGAWRQLRDSDRALSYLQEAVVRRSRSRLAAAAAGPAPYAGPAGERPALARPGPGLVTALRSLPTPQREALVLRYYADMPETRIASVMGISTRAVHSHIARGMSSLQAVLASH